MLHSVSAGKQREQWEASYSKSMPHPYIRERISSVSGNNKVVTL